MSIQQREVQNKRGPDGKLTGKSGTVYDVNITYKNVEGKRTSYQKKGFANKQDAAVHEAEMFVKLNTPGLKSRVKSESGILLSEYLTQWLESYGRSNWTSYTQI